MDIKSENISFILYRNYQNKYEKTSDSHDLSGIYNILDDMQRKKQLWDHAHQNMISAIIKDIDNKILSLSKDEFNLYVGETWNALVHIFATNRNCKRINYIEEGLSCYFDSIWKDTSFRLKKICKFILLKLFRTKSNRAISLGGPFNQLFFLHQNKPEFYTSSKNGYNLVKYKRHIIPLVINTKISLEYDYAIFICDGITKNFNIEIKSYLEAIKIIFRDFHHVNNLYIKFHPWQDSNERKQIVDLFTLLCISTIQLDDDIPLEAVFLTERREIIGIASSLLYYGKLAGCKCFCYNSILQNLDEKYRMNQISLSITVDKILETIIE
jgi:hypothetical protein